MLTRHGQPVARLQPVKRRLSGEELEAATEEIAEKASREASPGPSAARSQDFLYDEDGLPR